MNLDDFIQIPRFQELVHHRWSEKPAWRKEDFYLVDFEKFDVSQDYNGHGTERIVFSKQHILHRDAPGAFVSSSTLKDRRKWPVHGEKWKSTQYLTCRMDWHRHLSLDPPSITQEIYDSSLVSFRLAHYRWLHFCSTEGNLSNSSGTQAINKILPL